MSITISGFGAQQYQATPQIFQALSLGGGTPAPPKQPFGTPNQNLVPIARTAAAPTLNLSLQAAPIAAAIEALSEGATGQLAPAVASPALAAGAPLSTAFAGAKNGNVLISSGPPNTLDGVDGGIPPQGIVAFSVSTPVTDAAALLPNAPQTVSPTQQTPQPAQASAVARIVNTVKHLAVAAVYPQPIFTFSA